MKRIKVLFVLDTLEVGGAEKSLLTFLSRPCMFEAVVCHIYRGEALKQQFLQLGVKVISLNIDGPYNFVAAVRKLNTIIGNEEPSVIHATLLRSDLLLRWCASRAGIPLIVHLVGDSYSKERWKSNTLIWRIKNYVFFLINRLTTNRVSLFIAVTHLIKSNFIAAMKVPASRVRVVYRGRSVSAIGEGQVPFSQKRVSLINVGRLTKSKGQSLLIDAMSDLRKAVDRAISLKIVGNGPEFNMLQRKIDDLKLNAEVQLLGHRTDIPALLESSDIFLFPSLYEGAAGALIEAMLAGRPVIASDIPAFREYIENGTNGILFPVGNPAALIRSVLFLIENPTIASSLGKKARESAVQNFDLDVRNAEFEQVLLSVAG